MAHITPKSLAVVAPPEEEITCLIPEGDFDMSEDQIALLGAFLLLTDDQDFYEKCAAHARNMSSKVAGEYPSGELH